MELFLIIVMTLMIYIVLENNKIEELINRIYSIDSEIEKELKLFIGNRESLDIYSLREIREVIKLKYIDNHKLDDFKIYKESMYKISIILRLGLAVQRLELTTNSSLSQLKEVSLEYSNVNLKKNNYFV